MAQTRRQITTLIRRYIAALEARGILVERVILFGSHASGHPDEWSDIDIAVISPTFDTLSLSSATNSSGWQTVTSMRHSMSWDFLPPRWQTASPRAFLPKSSERASRCWCGLAEELRVSGERVRQCASWTISLLQPSSTW